jgi:hypothetical protein
MLLNNDRINVLNAKVFHRKSVLATILWINPTVSRHT